MYRLHAREKGLHPSPVLRAFLCRRSDLFRKDDGDVTEANQGEAVFGSVCLS